MTGLHTVLGAFAGVALAAVITILRVWSVNRLVSPSPDRPYSPDPAAAGRTHRGVWGEGGATAARIPPSADVLEAERRARRLGASFESTDPTP